MSFSLRLLVPFALACAACQSSSANVAAGAGVVRFPSFPGESVAGDVIVEARFYRDHERVFGVDLTRRANVVPIALRLGLVAGSPSRVRFAPEDAALQLIVADGSVLRPVAAAQIAGISSRVTSRASSSAADARWLPDWSRATDEFVYFALEPAADLRLRGTEVSHRTGDVVRSVDIDRSLIAFDVEIDGQRQPVRVGVKLDDAKKGN